MGKPRLLEFQRHEWFLRQVRRRQAFASGCSRSSASSIFLKDRGIGVLITDHNVRETLGICDRAYIISEGAVLAEGTPQDIVANADVRKVYLGEHFRM